MDNIKRNKGMKVGFVGRRSWHDEDSYGHGGDFGGSFGGRNNHGGGFNESCDRC